MYRQYRNSCKLLALLTATVIGLTVPMIAHAQAIPFAEHPHGHDCMTAATISLNSDVKALLLDPGDYAFYQIVLPRRGLLDVSIDPGAFDAWNMDLLDASCQAVDGVESDNSLVTGKWARITIPHKAEFSREAGLWTLAPGRYFIRIKPNPVDVFKESFVFRTTFTPHFGHDFETAEPVKLGGTIEGELLYAQDREVFRVTTTDLGLVRAWTSGPLEAPKEPVLYVYDSDGTKLDAPKSAGAPNAVMTGVLTPGTYFISVEPWRPEYLGKYTLHLDFIQTQPIFSQDSLGN
jgi:hypothetical protein